MRYKTIVEVEGNNLDDLVDGLNYVAARIDEGSKVDTPHDNIMDTHYTVLDRKVEDTYYEEA